MSSRAGRVGTPTTPPPWYVRTVRYLTLAEPFSYLADPIKGSRFLGLLAPTPTEDAAMAMIRAAEAEHADASHCCWSWRLRGGRSRIWDAGEPRGSAGRPILAQLEGHAVFDVTAVVLRWYGGTPLGIGGLMRAYGGTAGMALDRARLVEVAATVEVQVRFGYADTNPVHAAIAANKAEIVSTAYDDQVDMGVRVDETRLQALVDALRDGTHGRVVLELPPRPEPG